MTGTFTGQDCVLYAWCTSDPHTDTAPTSQQHIVVANLGDGDLAQLHRQRFERVLNDGRLIHVPFTGGQEFRRISSNLMIS